MSKRAKSRADWTLVCTYPPTAARLDAMEKAMHDVLFMGATLDEATALDIHQTIVGLREEFAGPKLGRRFRAIFDAATVRDLIDDHGATLDEAIYAILPQGTERKSKALKKAYQRLRTMEHDPRAPIVVVSPDRVAAAVARLRASDRDKKTR